MSTAAVEMGPGTAEAVETSVTGVAGGLTLRAATVGEVVPVVDRVFVSKAELLVAGAPPTGAGASATAPAVAAGIVVAGAELVRLVTCVGWAAPMLGEASVEGVAGAASEVDRAGDASDPADVPAVAVEADEPAVALPAAALCVRAPLVEVRAAGCEPDVVVVPAGVAEVEEELDTADVGGVDAPELEAGALEAPGVAALAVPEAGVEDVGAEAAAVLVVCVVLGGVAVAGVVVA